MRHFEILRKIEVVAERLGINVIRVNPKNTSKLWHTCSRKGTREGEVFTCDICGTFHADGNAAVNILQKGVEYTSRRLELPSLDVRCLYSRWNRVGCTLLSASLLPMGS